MNHLRFWSQVHGSTPAKLLTPPTNSSLLRHIRIPPPPPPLQEPLGSCNMEDEKDAEETPSRGNEWEVVSLTASAYAAAPPGPEVSDSIDDDRGDESSRDDEAWWKRQATSFYAQANEANAFWYVFVAAALMGIVIIGHRWQHERWQSLQSNINDEVVSHERLFQAFSSSSRNSESVAEEEIV